MEPFFKSDKKKKRRGDLNTECECFEAYEKDKYDEKRFLSLNFSHILYPFLVSFSNVTGKDVPLIVRVKYVATSVAVNIVSSIHMVNDMSTVKSLMSGMVVLIITLDPI